jgi:hypothetical protein
MTVRANHVAASDLRREGRETDSSPHERRHLRSFLAEVVELEDNRVPLTTADARSRSQVVQDVGLRFANTLRLQRVASLAVVISLLGVVRLETVAAPPLPT